MWWVLHALLFQAVAREFAVVRPFASDQEIQDMDAAFRLWNTVHPCGDKALAEFDIFVVYSRRLDENPAALTSATNIQNSFRARSEHWHRCFREFHVEAANLTAVEDIYDSRGYTVRKDWVNGPNKVFRFILQSFLQKSFASSNNYEAFFFMEFDSTPLRPFWLDQFYAEAVHYPRAAIRGSRYRGDSWDNFLHDIPDSLLYHMNGNAIYFLHHPWLHFLAQKMEEDANSENASTAFDVRMAQLTLEAATRSDLQTAWAESVPTGEDPYRDDSLLVGNYANTLLNESFEAPEFVRHGALTNIFENLNASSVTLAVQAFHQASATLLTESLNDARHHFGNVVVLSTPTLDFAFGNPGPSFREVRATLPEHMAICELASTVQTEYFVFTDTYHFMPGPMHVLANGSQPVLPYIPASSIFCTAYPECTSSLDQAESFFGVKLNYHHSKYETLFQTLLMREFCESWTLAADTLGSFESCDYQHGPTADDYIAWLISMNKLFDYVPKNKERVGWRHWSILWKAHPPDQRNCSIYRENDALRMQQSIKECSLYIQDADACNENPNCTFREIFEAGKCMSASEFQSLPAIMAARTLTRTTSTTRTTSLTTTTRSSSQTTSSWTSLTATSTSTATKSSIPPSTTRVTRTETTQTPLSTAIECQDGLPTTAGVDVSNCIGRVAGESCSVFCTGSFEGDPATFICGDDGTFSGLIQCQESTCTLETLPSGFPTDCEQTRPGSACFVRCPDGFHPAESTYVCMADRQFLGFPPICEPLLCSFGLPESVGVNSQACAKDIRYGQSCEVVCAYGFEGESSTYRCADGVFEGIPPSCVRKACQVPSDQGISFSCEGVLHGQSCLSTCNPGFTGAATQLQCEDGSLQGFKPNCRGALCSLEGITIEPGLDATECLGKSTSESCSLKCERGYSATGNSTLTCQPNGRFRSEDFRCIPKPCGNLSAVPSFSSSAIGDFCSGIFFGQTCVAFCQIGWQIEGNASILVCDDADGLSQGFVQFFPENRSYVPAAMTQPPTCNALVCTDGVPSMKGVSHDCQGKTTGETCQVGAQAGYFADPGPTTLTCQSDGQFVGEVPVIRPDSCPHLTFPSGVGSTCGNATLGTECWANCQNGWLGSPQSYKCNLNATGQLELVALQSITCTVNGSDGRRLAQSCSDPNADVRLLDSRFVHSCASATTTGDVCVVHCSSGYTMVEAEPALLSCADGQFVGGPLPSCTPQVCDFALPGGLGVEHDCQDRKTAENCTARCGEDFSYTSGGAETFTCMSSGNFRGTSPSCEPKLCQDLQLSDLYTHNCRQKRYGETCGVTCAIGYFSDSFGTQFRCNGTFYGTLPSCQPNPCTDVPVLGNLFKGNCEGLSTGESCELSCNAGFAPNSSLLTCNERGALVGSYPLCNPAVCPQSLAEIASIAHNCDEVVFGRSCYVYCAPGYDLLDETVPIWNCGLNASQLRLEGVLPHCKPAQCSLGLPISLVTGYTDNCTGLAFQEKCTLECATGYTTHTSATNAFVTYQCGNDRVAQADNTRPTCELTTCISNLSIPGVLSTCEDVQMNGSCFAFCAPGYRLEGNAQRWRCDASDLPAVDETAVVDGIGLRGLLPVCLLDTCSYNIPWSSRFVHNCDQVTTWSRCEVQCAEQFVGAQTSLQCQTTGALVGQLPDCQEVTITRTPTLTSTSTQTATTTFIFFISANLTLLVPDADALVSDPAAGAGFVSALAEIFQLPQEQVKIELQSLQDSGIQNLLVIAEIQSSQSIQEEEIRNRLDELTLDEVNSVVNKFTAIDTVDNSSQAPLTVLSIEIQVLVDEDAFVWALQAPAQGPLADGDSIVWVVILVASCSLLLCCCLGICIYRYLCRKASQGIRQAANPSDEDQQAKDCFEPQEPPSVQDAGMVDAGIYLEDTGIDNEEVRLALDDVGVAFYEEEDADREWLNELEPDGGVGTMIRAKDCFEPQEPPSVQDAGMVDAGIYLEEDTGMVRAGIYLEEDEGVDNEDAENDDKDVRLDVIGSEESDDDEGYAL